jgi:hypothetical protein
LVLLPILYERFGEGREDFMINPVEGAVHG